MVGLRLAAESAAEQSDMANYVFFRDAQLLRECVLRTLGILRGGPRCHFAAFEFRQRNHRLPRSVRQKRNVVVSLKYLATFGAYSIPFTDLTHHLSWLR